MIIEYFIKCLKNPKIYYYNGIKIYVGFNKNKLNLFKINKYIISVIIEIDNTNIINNIFDKIIDVFFKDSYLYGKISITANWYIFCKDISENDFYGINTKENINYRKMFNTFCLINKYDGNTFFNPAKIKNRVISERMKYLYNEYNKAMPFDFEKEKIFSIEIKSLYDVMEKVLNGINKNKYTRKIK